MINACENSSPLVLIVAIDEMSETSFIFLKFRGCAYKQQIFTTMVIFYSAKVEQAIKSFGFGITTIQKAIIFYNYLVNADTTPMRNYFSTDGEALY